MSIVKQALLCAESASPRTVRVWTNILQVFFIILDASAAGGRRRNFACALVIVIVDFLRVFWGFEPGVDHGISLTICPTALLELNLPEKVVFCAGPVRLLTWNVFFTLAGDIND